MNRRYTVAVPLVFLVWWIIGLWASGASLTRGSDALMATVLVLPILMFLGAVIGALKDSE